MKCNDTYGHKKTIHLLKEMNGEEVSDPKNTIQEKHRKLSFCRRAMYSIGSGNLRYSYKVERSCKAGKQSIMAPMKRSDNFCCFVMVFFELYNLYLILAAAFAKLLICISTRLLHTTKRTCAFCVFL